MYDALIIGGGVVGCAVARALVFKKPEWKIAVFEKEFAVARHSSGRNSGVLHSGFNLKPGSLKARFCVEGNRRWREYCGQKNIACRQIGTMVVALNAKQTEVLHELYRRGQGNGVPDLQILDQKQMTRLEPNARGEAALWSPTGSIVDSRALVVALIGEAKEHGVELFLVRKVLDVRESSAGYEIIARHQNDSVERYQAKILINCAGLYADVVAHQLGVGKNYAIFPFRGEYLYLKPAKSDLIRSMVYPAPDLNYPFLGVHWTKKINGRVALGPNATLAFGRESYKAFHIHIGETARMVFSRNFMALFQSSAFRKLALKQIRLSLFKEEFMKEASALVRGATAEDIEPGPAGNRAQLVDRQGRLLDDMALERKGASWHVLNAVSPGLTCSLPFADYLVEQITA